jgi:hypothetical protein
LSIALITISSLILAAMIRTPAAREGSLSLADFLEHRGGFPE